MPRRSISRIPRAKAAWIKLLKQTKLVTEEELQQRRILDAEWFFENCHKDIDEGDNYYPPHSSKPWE